MIEQMYYIQNVSQGYVGNSLLWWKHDNCGYVCDVQEAKEFTKAEIDKMDTIKDGTNRAWPVEYIDNRIQHHIDMQDVNHEQAIQTVQSMDQL